jgi:hypothetical protein
MAMMELKLRTRIAWWVRPSLFGLALVARLAPSRVERCIDIIVDKGIRVELADS